MKKNCMLLAVVHARLYTVALSCPVLSCNAVRRLSLYRAVPCNNTCRLNPRSCLCPLPLHSTVARDRRELALGPFM